MRSPPRRHRFRKRRSSHRSLLGGNALRVSSPTNTCPQTRLFGLNEVVKWSLGLTSSIHEKYMVSKLSISLLVFTLIHKLVSSCFAMFILIVCNKFSNDLTAREVSYLTNRLHVAVMRCHLVIAPSIWYTTFASCYHNSATPPFFS